MLTGLSTGPQPFLASLSAAMGSVQRGNAVAAINQLQAFQKKVGAQAARKDPALARELIEAAQQIIDALSDGTSAAAPPLLCR